MTRPFLPLALVAVAIAQLTGCAQPGPQAVPPAADAPLASTPTPIPAPLSAVSAAVPEAPASAASDAQDSAQRNTDPILIRGDDRVIATPRNQGAAAARGPVGSFKFEDAPVSEVVKVMLGDLLKVDYVIHPPLAGTVTLSTRAQVPADRAMFLLEQALQANGIVMARDARGTYHVGTPEALRGIVSAPQLAGKNTMPPGYGVVIIAPQYLGAGEVANILRPLVSADAIVRVDNLRNILVMRGTRAEAEGWMDIVNTFDVNLLRGMSVGVFPLKHTSVADADAALRMLSGGVSGQQGAATAATASGGASGSAGAARTGGATPGGSAAASAAAGTPAALGEANPLFGALRIMPIERINALLVITPRAAYLDEVRYWIEQFDRPNLNSAEPQLFVYKVQNGSADHLAELLNGIYGGTTVAQPQGATGATGVAPGLATTASSSAGLSTTGNLNGSFASTFTGSSNRSLSGGTLGSSSAGTGLGSSSTLGSGSLIGGRATAGSAQGGAASNVTAMQLGQNVRVMADRINNTLLIHASPAEFARIESTLKRLDIQRAQVLIEASIVEVTLGDGLEYGLQWAFRGSAGGGRTGAGVLNNSPSSTISLSDGAYGLAGAAAQGFSYAVSNSAGSVTAMLSALATKSLLKVISSPSLMVLDNHTAAIQVGSQQPINTGTVINTNSNYSSSSIQYKDTGVMLGVTPSVNAGDLVTLDISQTVTDLGNESTSSPTRGYPTFLQRQIESKVAVRSGETLVLGGLIKDSNSNSKSGLPILSSIPILGAMFGQHGSTSGRTELLVILTPRVLRSDEDARAVSRELRQRMQGLTLSNTSATSKP